MPMPCLSSYTGDVETARAAYPHFFDPDLPEPLIAEVSVRDRNLMVSIISHYHDPGNCFSKLCMAVGDLPLAPPRGGTSSTASRRWGEGINSPSPFQVIYYDVTTSVRM
jgi:hypothetical protein